MTEPLLDLTRDDDRHLADRLGTERVIWLGTVRPDGRPHLVPVWFAWADPVVWVFSPADTAKARNLRANPQVSLALDAMNGSDVVLADGHAERVDLAATDTPPPFVEKYAPLLGTDDFTGWRGQFDHAYRITVVRLRSWVATPEGPRPRNIDAA